MKFLKRRYDLGPALGLPLCLLLCHPLGAQSPSLAQLKAGELAAAQASKQDLADAQELEGEAALVEKSPGETSAAVFARQRAAQLRVDAAAADQRAQAARAQIAALEGAPAPAASPAPGPGPAPASGTAPAVAAPGAVGTPLAPASGLDWGAWDPVASCSGVDVHFATAIATDGGEQVKMQFLNHNAFATAITFRAVFLGSSGQRLPSAGDSTITLNPNSKFELAGELVPFAIAQYGFAAMTVNVQQQAGAASMSLACPVRPKSVPR